MAAISYKCPNCGGDLRFDPATQKYKCEYCVSTFTQQEVEAANPQAQEEADSQAAQQSAQNGAVVYSCPSCGAQIITDETTAATFCYYCHNPVVLQGKLSGEYEPDLIIPFAIEKKKAVDSFLKYVRSRRFVPRDFFNKEQIAKISGVYFPFWLYSCQAQGSFSGTGDQISIYQTGDVEYTQTKVFAVERQAELTFQNMTRDALNKENRQLVEAVQPFRLEQAQPFSMSYLAGFLAEKRDIEKTDLQGELQQEMEEYAGQMMRAEVSGYNAVRTVKEEVRVREEDWKYLLLPVWVLTYKGKDGQLYYYAMNGQSGKICGVLPLDKGRVVTFFLGIFLAVLLLLLIGGYFGW